MRRILVPLLLLAVVGVALPSGLDLTETTQSAGIFVRFDGGIHAIYLDYRPIPDGAKVSAPVTLRTDLPLFTNGHRIPSGTHEWLFEGEAGSLSIGPAGRKGVEAFRLNFMLSPTSPGSRWMAASLTPAAAGEAVVLTLRLGDRQGQLLLALREGEPEGDAEVLDVPRIQVLRDRLRRAAGALAGAGRGRYFWSRALREIGDALMEGEGAGHLTGFGLDRSDERVTLTITGYMQGERERVDEFAADLRRSILGSRFPRIAKPLARLGADGRSWDFDIRAECPSEEWDAALPVDELDGGGDAAGLAREILLLEARIWKETQSAVKSIEEGQALLLEARREAGVLVSGIRSGAREKDENGIFHFPLELSVSGPGAAVLKFLRKVEQGRPALTILPRKLSPGAFGPELALTVVFHHVPTVAESDPDLWPAIRRWGRGEGFAEELESCLAGIERASPPPFLEPVWSREPFAAPLTK